jgi:hypothetical protein
VDLEDKTGGRNRSESNAAGGREQRRQRRSTPTEH